MDPIMILLRIVHVFSGVFWVGGAVMTFGFLGPTAQATAPEGQRFMQHLIVRQRFSAFMGLASVLTVLAGAALYLRDSGGFQLVWIATGPGIVFTIGAISGFAVFIVGMFGIRPATERLSALGTQIGAGGRPPTEEQAAELGALNGRMSRLNHIHFWLLTIALLAMATARYF